MNRIIKTSLSVLGLAVASISCTPTYNYASAPIDNVHAYRPKAKAGTDMAQSISVSYDTQDEGYYEHDENLDYGQIDYNLSMRGDWSIHNLNASLGAGQYTIDNGLSGRRDLFYTFLMGSYEFSAYTRYESAGLEWRYIQVGFGGGSDMGAYAGTMRRFDGDLDTDTLDFNFSGSQIAHFYIATELNYALGSNSNMGLQLGFRQNLLSAEAFYAYPFTYLYYEHKNYGAFVGFNLYASTGRSNVIDGMYTKPATYTRPTFGVYYSF